MMNWNDLRVEQEIAQERYQRLIRQREIDRLFGPQPSLFRLTIGGLGRCLVSWGHRLEIYSGPRPCCA